MFTFDNPRDGSYFKTLTYNNFKKTGVKNKFVSYLTEENIEQANLWCAELVSSGHYLFLWETIFEYTCVNIYIANPKVWMYIKKKYILFKDKIMRADNELHLRNNSEIRNLFFDVVSVICLSNKEKLIIPKEFNKTLNNITEITSHFKADNLHYVVKYFKENDPKEIYIFLNEYIYNLENKNFYMSVMWLKWILDYNKQCTKKKVRLECDERFNNEHMKESLKRHCVWILWDIVIDKSKKNTLHHELIGILNDMFMIQIEETKILRRVHLIILATKVLMLRNDQINLPLVKSSKCKDTISIYRNKIDHWYFKIHDNYVKYNSKNDKVSVASSKKGQLKDTSMKKLNILETFLNSNT